MQDQSKEEAILGYVIFLVIISICLILVLFVKEDLKRQKEEIRGTIIKKEYNKVDL